MPPLVKICGLSTPETVDAAIRLGATHIGLVHYEPSPRHVDLKTAAALRQRAGGKVKVALLLVNASQQVTGEALSAFEGAADRILFDAPAAALPGGTGARFDWSLLKGHRHSIDWGVAGGLTPANVAQAIAETGAPLVDVSSGVESAPGVKDMDKIAAFLKAVGRC